MVDAQRAYRADLPRFRRQIGACQEPIGMSTQVLTGATNMTTESRFTLCNA